MEKSLLILLLVGVMVAPAAAALETCFEYRVVPSGAAEGYIVNDLRLTTDTDWLGSQLIIALTAGHIYNEGLYGGLTAPNPALFDAVPDLEWDSWVAADGYTLPAVGIDGAAVDFPDPDGGRDNFVGRFGTDFGPSGGSAVVSDMSADVAWGWTATDDVGVLHNARFTLSPDAMGTLSIRVSAKGTPNTVRIYSIRIVDGEMPIRPEPGSWILLVSGGLLMLTLRRR